MKTINLEKIKETLKSQSEWRRETRDQLKRECLKMIGTSEWHFQKSDLFPNTSYKYISAGFRVEDGELYWLCADGMCRRTFSVDKKYYEVATWHWQKFDLKRIDWWVMIYGFILNVKHTEHADFTQEYVTRDYSSDVEGYAERYFGISLKGAKKEDAIAVKL